jgi:hypothetical protein
VIRSGTSIERFAARNFNGAQAAIAFQTKMGRPPLNSFQWSVQMIEIRNITKAYDIRVSGFRACGFNATTETTSFCGGTATLE